MGIGEFLAPRNWEGLKLNELDALTAYDMAATAYGLERKLFDKDLESQVLALKDNPPSYADSRETAPAHQIVIDRKFILARYLVERMQEKFPGTFGFESDNDVSIKKSLIRGKKPEYVYEVSVRGRTDLGRIDLGIIEATFRIHLKGGKNWVDYQIYPLANPSILVASGKRE